MMAFAHVAHQIDDSVDPAGAIVWTVQSSLSSDVVGASLDHLIGSWSDAEEAEFLRSLEDLEEIALTTT